MKVFFKNRGRNIDYSSISFRGIRKLMCFFNKFITDWAVKERFCTATKIFSSWIFVRGAKQLGLTAEAIHAVGIFVEICSVS